MFSSLCAGAAVLAVLAQRGSPGRRAVLYASAAAIMWALVATFILARGLDRAAAQISLEG